MKRWFAVSLLALVFVAAGVALFPEPAFADGIIIPRPPPERPELRWRDVPLTVKYHHVDVTIKNQVAVTHVDQVFVNDAPYAVEGTYMFPLPEDAAISSFEMWVDGQKLEGRLLGREQARQIYEDIVRREKDPALLEYAGRGAFQASIFPIPPRAERRVELTYTQALASREGLTGYSYPLNTEKFSARPLGEVKVNVTVEERAPLRAIYSPSHEVEVKRNGDRSATVSYRATNVKPGRDFELYYSLSPDSVALNLLSYKPFDEDGFFLLLVTPPVTAASDEVVDRDVILVMDVSGSMAGEKIDQAKAAAGYVLDHLGEGDRFNIVAFSTSTRLFSSTPVSLARRDDGRAFVKGLRAEGSTDINRALLEGLGGADPERPTVLIFLTDGLPTAGEVNADKIIANVAARAAKSVRLFAFGVGYDVDTTLLDRLSSGQRGTSSYVQPKQAIDEVVSGFYARIGAPVLIDTTLKVNGTTVEDMYPFPLPDLYAGTQLVVAGRYRQGGPVTHRAQWAGQRQAAALQLRRPDSCRTRRERVYPAALGAAQGGVSAGPDPSARRQGRADQGGGQSQHALRHHHALHLISGPGARQRPDAGRPRSIRPEPGAAATDSRVRARWRRCITKRDGCSCCSTFHRRRSGQRPGSRRACRRRKGPAELRACGRSGARAVAQGRRQDVRAVRPARGSIRRSTATA